MLLNGLPELLHCLAAVWGLGKGIVIVLDDDYSLGVFETALDLTRQLRPVYQGPPRT